MNYNKKSVEDIDVQGKQRPCAAATSTCPPRAASSPATSASSPRCRPSNICVKHGAKVILCSHMGKPKGEVKPELSLKRRWPTGCPSCSAKTVKMAEDVVGDERTVPGRRP